MFCFNLIDKFCFFVKIYTININNRRCYMATNNLMNKITLYYSQMTKAEKKVADFVLSSPQEALASTITDLSKHCGVGETSVFRFCRTLE